MKGLIKEKSGEVKSPIITNKKEYSAVTQYRLLGIFNQNSLNFSITIDWKKTSNSKAF